MFLIVGLGNPGEKYEKTRHNVGFMVLDLLHQHIEAEAFHEEKPFHAMVSICHTKQKKLILAKPLTFMNNSGDTVSKLMAYYKVPLENVLIVHDESDIEFGTLRLHSGKSSAGHNGVASIIVRLGSSEFLRLRIGIRPVASKAKKAETFVLKPFARGEKTRLPDILRSAVNGILIFLHEGALSASNELHRGFM